MLVNIHRLYSAVFAAAISLTAFAFVLGSQSYMLPLAQAGFILLPVAMMSSAPGYMRFDRRNLFFIMLVTSALFFNVLINLHNYSEHTVSPGFVLLHIAGLAGMLFALQWAATNLSPQLVLMYLAYMLTPLILWAVFVSIGQSSGVRATPFGLHPNWWGELTFAYVFCLLSLPRRTYKYLLILVSLFFLYIVRSRSGLLAVVVCLGSYAVMTNWPQLWSRRKLDKRYLVLALLAVMSALVFHQLIYTSWLFFIEEVLLLNDPYRGLGTGLTGRIDGWNYALNTFYQNPVFGCGLDILSDVHNGFLRIAGEGGIVLCAVVLLPVVVALASLGKERNYLAASMIIGYIAYVMFQPRMLNMNVASTLFFFCVFRWRCGSGLAVNSKKSIPETPLMLRGSSHDRLISSK